MQVAKTATYPVICPLPLFAALSDHNPPTLQTDRQTDGRHARITKVTCYAIYQHVMLWALVHGKYD